MIFPPNLIITNFCNQNCPFCFAGLEMSKNEYKKEMSIKTFSLILNRMKREGVDTVKLLGGEPTLHSKFIEILELSLKKCKRVQLFTNGMYSIQIEKYLLHHSQRVGITFNVTTPGYILQKKIRNLVVKRISQLAGKNKITLSCTIDPFINTTVLLSSIPDDILSKVQIIRLGLANPMQGEKNMYRFEDFPKIGGKIYEITNALKRKNYKGILSLNCGLTRCMFTELQYTYLMQNRVDLFGFGCFGKKSSMDISTENKAFHCFPLSETYRIDGEKNNLTKTSALLLLKRVEYQKKIQLIKCIACPFFGIEVGKCPGPCIAFRSNELSI